MSHALEDLTEDASGRELFGKMPVIGQAAAHLVAYLGLFKPRRQALRWSRALVLADDVIQLSQQLRATEQQLAAAMSETVEAMRDKRQQPNWQPFTKHNYLRKVLEGVITNSAAQPATDSALTPVQSSNKPLSKTAAAIEMLKGCPSPEQIPEWFTRTVCGSMAELLLMGLESVPAADTMELVAGRWLNELWPKRDWAEQSHMHNPKRLHDAIIAEAESNGRWPSLRAILGYIPKV
ncbi:hypothetical protein BOW53_02885 [Solemya pervernicosa gill symbiont]|uniref:Uncharacterized protein n=2 Tax=Solemya pervernicosa gill symbiont TaxID=642797 RepID=A0A1T2L980_9GAMM|nr:hypothetical protein BOW53_02885 [Solemya pervernicosa gill symbiont]